MPVEMTDTEDRSLGKAVLNGMRLRCPHCGNGRLFRAYLKVADKCEICGEEFHYHRADDFPPYLSIVIVGHIIVGLMLHLEMSYDTIAPWMYVATMVPAAIVLPLLMLPSVKGAVVGLQWANKMYGFDPANRASAARMASHP
jgi:uncharacterized protein (DUF983 family)